MILAETWITALAGLLLGAALVRANSCTVASTRRLIIERRADWMLGLFVAIGWAGLVLLSFAFLWPIKVKFPADMPIAMPLVIGSIVLGMGALLNKGCFLGSVSQLCRGNLNYLFTLAGIAVALILVPKMHNGDGVTGGKSAADAIAAVNFTWFGCLAAIIFGVMILYSIRKLARRRTIPMMALIIVGVAGGVIYTFNPDWSYTSVLDRAIHGSLDAHNWALEIGAVAMFGGATISSILGSKFTLVWPSLFEAAGCSAGGFLMGSGAAMIPGGNDTMMLWSIPGLAQHGIIAYLIMVATIAAGFIAMQYGSARIKSR